ncbi:unnamed protein product [Prunus armeniaca]|uniref:Membrane-associated kinase regulator 6 n=1 Tax=Prunus armeniaca TaxID=36596 RepID=A0A6J5U841_PRUAR|nr:unnamed protein product [Prunus armeniaca]
MEASQPLSIESFSYSWLVNLKPSLESLDNSLRTSLDASDESSFIEMDPTMSPSKRFFMNSQQDFKFDFPAVSQSPLTTLVHADELISNGYLLPLSVDSLKNMEAYDHSASKSTGANFAASSSHSARDVDPTDNSRDSSNSLRRCRRLSRRILEKYLNFLRPLYKKIRGDHHHHHHHHKANPKAGFSADKRSHSVKNCRVHSSETSQSPRISVAYSADDWRRKLNGLRDVVQSSEQKKKGKGRRIHMGREEMRDKSRRSSATCSLSSSSRLNIYFLDDNVN